MLAFAASHTAHLGLILTLAAKMGWAQFIHAFTWVTVIVGGGGFLLIYALAWKALRKRTRATSGDSRLEAFAYYYLWGIFALTYAGSSFRSGFYIPIGLVVLAALFLRLTAAWQSRRLAGVSPAPN